MTDKAAIILGASGSVGQSLIEEIVRCGKFNRVIAIVRRPLGLNLGTPIDERLVPYMDPPGLTQAVVDALNRHVTDAVGFSVLGVGADTAKLTLKEHRAIDVDLNAAFAKGLKDSGKVAHLVYMSAVGADINAKITGSGVAGMGRYSRVKGEAEAAVQDSGPTVVSIFRPAMIIGSRHTPRLLAVLFTLLSPLIPAKYRPIRTNEIAHAMVAAALGMPGTSAIYSFPEMKKLITNVPKHIKSKSLAP